MEKDLHKTIRIASLMGINKIWAANRRIFFLEEEIRSLQQMMINPKNSPMGVGILAQWAEGHKKEICYLKEKKVIILEAPKQLMRLTDDQIQIANQHPIENIIHFINGKATAWCHEDKNPSLTLWRKGNKAKCWVCDKLFSPIDVVMERDGLNFVDAVKMLQ